MSSYREQFFEWVDKQPLYQAMNLQAKEMALHLVDCWLNNNYAYLSNARLDGKGFAKRCAIDFCWFIRNQTISDLEAKLAESEKEKEYYQDLYFISIKGQENLKQQLADALKDFNDIQEENDKLAQQLAEKDELLKQKIGDMKSTDFIRMCVECGLMVKAKENDKQTAIEELEKLKKEINLRPVIVRNCGYGDFEEILLEDVYDVINQQIKLLKGENK